MSRWKYNEQNCTVTVHCPLAVVIVLFCVQPVLLNAAGAAATAASDMNNMLRDNNTRPFEQFVSIPTILSLPQGSSQPLGRKKLGLSHESITYEIRSDNHVGSEMTGAAPLRAASESNYKLSDVDGGFGNEHISLMNQVRLLSKQLNALMLRRREDYELLEHNLRKSLKLPAPPTTSTTDLNGAEFTTKEDKDIRNELEQLRLEVKYLRDSRFNENKERLTVEWLQQSVAELRMQLVELQQISGVTAKDIALRTQGFEDLATIRSDSQELKLEMVALRECQQRTEVFVQELREETIQQEEDYKRLLLSATTKTSSQQHFSKTHEASHGAQQQELDQSTMKVNHEITLADHKRRHYRYQSEQIHKMQLAQRNMKRQLNELKFHRIDERVRNIEIEQHRIANANFNLSRQIAAFDKLHSSMLELLEDVEALQNKMDKGMPELSHEISKLDFSNAQLISEQNLMREEGKNLARSVQAMAVSVSALQDEREEAKQARLSLTALRTNVDNLHSKLDAVQHTLHREHYQSVKKHRHGNSSSPTIREGDAHSALTEHAESLVVRLENVEQQYESIIEKLPQDCNEVIDTKSGVYLIAPNGQHRPLMAHCSAGGWTLVQRRFDGSTDFNRSWEDYATGFGTPTAEYWIGNEQLHHLTLQNTSALRIVMQDIYDNIWVAEYTQFFISSRADGYRLHVGGYKGNASDALDYQQGMQFSAIDVDRDISQTHCAANYEGGWWFSHCQHANLNGRYNLGLTWFDAARNEWIAVKSSQMLLRRSSGPTASGVSSLSADDGGQTTNFPSNTALPTTTTTTVTTTATPIAQRTNTAAPVASFVVV